jgi:hypothetical protein
VTQVCFVCRCLRVQAVDRRRYAAGGGQVWPPRVRRPAPAGTVRLPDVAGLDKKAALAGLDSAGLSIGQIQTQSTHSLPPGTVLRTSSAAGSRLTPGTPVNLLIATP